MNLLITGAFDWKENELELLRSKGHGICFMQYEKDPLPCPPDWVEGVICNGLFLHHNIEDFKSLSHIQLTSAGFDRVPLDYISEHSISVYNANGVYSIPMAEFAVCSALRLYKQSDFFCDNQKQRCWDKHRNLRELFGKTVLIVGCGNVGTECAKRFKAFGCQIFGVDINSYASEFFEEIFPLDSLNEYLSKSDIIILTLPLTEQTHHLFDKDHLSHIKSGAILINISRGAVIDTEALTKALGSTLSGVALDVFESEPLDRNSGLWELENVIITPHNSFVGEGNHDRMLKLIFENLK